MRNLTGFGEVTQDMVAVVAARSKGVAVDRYEMARKRGHKVAEREFQTRSAQGAVVGASGFLTSEPLATAVIGSIPRASVAGEIIAVSRPLPSFHARYIVTDTADLAAQSVQEGQSVPVLGTTATSITVKPEAPTGGKVSAIVPYSVELAADPAAPAVIESDFRIIAQRGVDAAIRTAVAPDSTSSFSASADSPSDMKELLGALGDLSGIAPPILAASPNTLLKIGLVRDAGGWLWPEVGLAGGHMLGCPIFPCDALPDGVVRALNGEVLAARFGPIDIVASQEAAVQMDTDPSGDAATGAGTTMVSAWQNNVILVRFTIPYAIVALRDGTHGSELVGVDW